MGLVQRPQQRLRPDHPLITFYGLSGDARVRSEFQTALRVKIFSDFTFSVNGYDSYDSSPPQDEVKNDYGVSLSLGWKF